MNGLYTEAYVKCKMGIGAMVLKIAMIVLGVVLLLGGLAGMSSGSGGVVAFLGVIVLVAFYFVNPLFSIDWEYIFCDGQIDFDKISGGEKRKTILKIDMDNIEIMAPVGSHELDSYNNNQNYTLKDFSSKTGEGKCYCIITNKDNQRYKIIFEPTETMVDYAKQKAPRKVFKD